MLRNPDVSEAQAGAADWSAPLREKDTPKERNRDAKYGTDNNNGGWLI